jgi:hypothetical protein
MKVWLGNIFIILFLTTLAGCMNHTQSLIAYHEEQMKHKDDSVIYVYRCSSFVGGAVPVYVFVDDELTGLLNQGAYMPIHIERGVHSLFITPRVDQANNIIQMPRLPKTKKIHIGKVKIPGVSVGDVSNIAVAGMISYFDAQNKVAGDLYDIQSHQTYYIRVELPNIEFVSHDKAVEELPKLMYDTGR